MEHESLVVLPSLRLAHLRQAVNDITGDLEMTQRVLEAVEEHVERDAYRWGNACPECHRQVHYKNSSPVCPTHGHLGRLAPTELLIAFKPSRSTT
jgi:hypothetical protein